MSLIGDLTARLGNIVTPSPRLILLEDNLSEMRLKGKDRDNLIC